MFELVDYLFKIQFLQQTKVEKKEIKLDHNVNAEMKKDEKKNNQKNESVNKFESEKEKKNKQEKKKTKKEKKKKVVQYFIISYTGSFRKMGEQTLRACLILQ